MSMLWIPSVFILGFTLGLFVGRLLHTQAVCMKRIENALIFGSKCFNGGVNSPLPEGTRPNPLMPEPISVTGTYTWKSK